MHVAYPIACDRVLGLGVPPTIRVQRLLGRPGRTTALDRTLTWVHWLWFLEPHVAAGWILLRHPRALPSLRRDDRRRLRPRRDRVRDACRPRRPGGPPSRACCRRGGSWRRSGSVSGVASGGLYTISSEATQSPPCPPFTSRLQSWLPRCSPRPGRLEGALGWAYASALGVALVHLGEHYVIDLIAGAGLAKAVHSLGPRTAPALQLVSRGLQSLESRAGA